MVAVLAATAAKGVVALVPTGDIGHRCGKGPTVLVFTGGEHWPPSVVIPGRNRMLLR